MEKGAKYLLIIVVVISIIISLFYLQTYEKTTHNFSYSVAIDKIGSGNYTVIVPFPTFNNDEQYWTQVIMDNMTINGSTEMDLIETINGYGLQISSNDSCRLSTYLRISVPALSLTMKNSTNNETYNPSFWIYGQQNNCNISISVRMFEESCTTTMQNLRPWSSGGGPYVFIPWNDRVDIIPGWNQYEAEESYMCIN